PAVAGGGGGGGDCTGPFILRAPFLSLPRKRGRGRCGNARRSRRATMTSSQSPLVLPLAALFVAFFVAPLIVLVALSLTADTAAWTAANYVKFFTDRFNYSILWDTL